MNHRFLFLMSRDTVTLLRVGTHRLVDRL
jgi:hypothetical protein